MSKALRKQPVSDVFPTAQIQMKFIQKFKSLIKPILSLGFICLTQISFATSVVQDDLSAA